MTSFRDITRDAVQFWEWRRIIYNAVLAGIVIVGFALAWPSSTSWFSQPAFPAILKAAVLANVAYCAAYVVELLFYLSPYRESWRQRRMILFVLGVILAALLTAATVFVVAFGPLDHH